LVTRHVPIVRKTYLISPKLTVIFVDKILSPIYSTITIMDVCLAMLKFRKKNKQN